MTSLTDRFTEYLDHRRRFGADPASLELALKPFVTYADARQAEWITTELFLQWKATFGSAGLNTWAARLSLLRGFARWSQAIDERNEVPPKGLIPRRSTRPQPWIYSDAEIARIVATAATLPSPRGLRGCTYATLFGLLAVTGLRISEALGLDDQDVDAENAVLVIQYEPIRRVRCALETLSDERDWLHPERISACSGSMTSPERSCRTTLTCYPRICRQDHLGEPGTADPMKGNACQRDTEQPMRLCVPLLG